MSNECYRPLIEDMVWSYSRVTCFDDCPYKWFIKYIHFPKEDESPMFYSSYGKFMHKLIELYYKNKITRDEMKLKFLTEFKDNVKGDRPSAKIVSDYINKGIHYIETFKPVPYNIIDVEKRIDFKIDDKKFVCVIDMVCEEDGDIYIIDNKSRDLKPRSSRKTPTLKDVELDEMLKQLYIYSVAVYQHYGKYPKYLCFNCFKSGVFIKEPFDINRLEEIVSEFLNKISMIESSEDFYPRVDYFYCNNLCGFSKSCVYNE